MENFMKEFIEIIRYNPDVAFGFVCNNMHAMSKKDMENIIKELVFAIVESPDKEYIFDNVANELEEIMMTKA